MKRCTNCQNMYNDNMNYCPNCGSQLVDANQHFANPLPKTNCPYCSKLIPVNSEYCEFCGMRITPYIYNNINENYARNSYQPQPNNLAYASFIIALLSILALCASPVFSIIMCIIAFILAVLATNVKYEKRNGFIITALVASMIICFVSFCVIIFASSDNDRIGKMNNIYTTEQTSESEVSTEYENEPNTSIEIYTTESPILETESITNEQSTEDIENQIKQIEMSEDEYKNACNELWYDDIFFSEDDLTGTYVKLDLFIEESYYFTIDDMYYNTVTSDFINQYDLKRTFFKCGIKREDTNSYVGSGQITLYFPNTCGYSADDFQLGEHLILYGEIISYSTNTWDGYNSCSIIPKYIESND